MISIRPWPHKHFFFFCLVIVATHAGVGRGLFSPRMDYEEWTPLGRGDPLKNDPTYDYVPPVLERVNYWQEPEARTPDPPRSTASSPLLLLGVASAKKSPGKPEAKKPPHADSRRDNYDPLMQFINERKHTVSRVRPQYIPLQGGYLAYRPSAMRPPYTMLVPPPLSQYPPATIMTTDHYQTEGTTTALTWESESMATSGSTTTRTTETSSTEGTTFATPESTAATTTHVHKLLAPMIDINPTGHHSLSSSLLQIILQNEMATTLQPTSTPTPTTPHPSLTTDPLFSHYKQPAEPLRGPMYLIIQGHSKVKTYGASKLDKLSGIPIQDNNEVGNRRRRSRQVDLEDFLPVEETLEAVINDYVDNDTIEGSGLKQILAAVTS